MKKIIKKKSYKFLFFITLLVISLSSALIPINASGIEYEENGTFYNFDINKDYPYFISNLYDLGYMTFNYSVMLPIEFYVNDFKHYNLRIDVVNGGLSNISAEYLNNLGMPNTQYFFTSGAWNEGDVTTDVLLREGLLIEEPQMQVLYDFNFQYIEDNSRDNLELRWLKYQVINQLMTIKLSSFRMYIDVEAYIREYLDVFENIAPFYVDDAEYSTQIMSGLSLGIAPKDTDGERITLDLPKWSFNSNNERFNELSFIYEYNARGEALPIGHIDYFVRYNNLEVVGSISEGYSNNNWINYNYRYITIFSDLGLYDMLNLSLLGEFNVAPYLVGFDKDSTFGDLFTGIANVPIIVLSNLLSFSIFGWQAFAVLCGIITLLVIIWLIRKLTR